MTHRPRLVVVTIILGAAVAAAWWLGLMDGLGTLGFAEFCFLGFLAVIFVLAKIEAVRGRWDHVRFYANVLPAWGLPLTGLGVVLSVVSMHSLDATELLRVFRSLCFSVAPNIAATLGYAWLNTTAWVAANEEI